MCRKVYHIGWSLPQNCWSDPPPSPRLSIPAEFSTQKVLTLTIRGEHRIYNSWPDRCVQSCWPKTVRPLVWLVCLSTGSSGSTFVAVLFSADSPATQRSNLSTVTAQLRATAYWRYSTSLATSVARQSSRSLRARRKVREEENTKRKKPAVALYW